MIIDTAIQNESVNRVSPAAAARGEGARAASSAVSGFGPAFVREAAAEEEDAGTYGSDARMIQKLEQRDRQVRQTEEAKGEAVGDSNYMYQVGPDGKRYAVGTGPHAVRKEGPFAAASNATDATGKELSREDEALLAKLEARDAKVRSHEAAHVMAAGGQAGMPTYTYQTGPDGRRYAIGGSVNISMMTTGDEEQNLRQARRAYRAAMATGEPSARDMQTAMRANAKADEAATPAEQYAKDAENKTQTANAV